MQSSIPRHTTGSRKAVHQHEPPSQKAHGRSPVGWEFLDVVPIDATLEPITAAGWSSGPSNLAKSTHKRFPNKPNLQVTTFQLVEEYLANVEIAGPAAQGKEQTKRMLEGFYPLMSRRVLQPAIKPAAKSMIIPTNLQITMTK